jgi:hypothetical protein
MMRNNVLVLCIVLFIGIAGLLGCGGGAGSDGVNGTNGTDGTNGTNGTDGTNGTNGTDGNNGFDSLIKLTQEPAGNNCENGGQLIETGLDFDRDGFLDDYEVTSTAYVCSGSGDIKSLNLIDMHSGVLRETGYQPEETGGLLEFVVANESGVGDTVISLTTQVTGLVEGQLVVFDDADGKYFSGKISSVNYNTITLSNPLQTKLLPGSKVSNFYTNHSHPNTIGYYAIADSALNHFKYVDLNRGIHVLFGDSWVGAPYIFNRLKEALPGAAFINKGKGGDKVTDLHNRFNTDVVPDAPDYVWVMCGTNDYFAGVSAEAYVTGMQQLIDRIESIGATAIIFSPSVGPLIYPGRVDGELIERSTEYANAIKSLRFDNRIY